MYAADLASSCLPWHGHDGRSWGSAMLCFSKPVPLNPKPQAGSDVRPRASDAECAVPPAPGDGNVVVPSASVTTLADGMKDAPSDGLGEVGAPMDEGVQENP